MKTNKYFFEMAVMMGVMTIAACSSYELDLPQDTQVIHFTTSLAKTRTTGELQTTALSTSVKVGVFGVSGNTTILNGNNNLYNVATDASLTANAADMARPAGTSDKVDIYAYAPYQNEWTSYDAANSFSVSTDQSTDAGYLASDLLWATVKEVSSNANLNFVHKLARVCITITNATANTMQDVSASILNTKIATTLNPKNGEIGTATGEPTAINIASGQNLAVNAEMKAYAVVVPQKIESEKVFITITTNNKTMEWELNSDTTLESAKTYNIAIVVTDHSIWGQISTTATEPAL
ncbi:MAG: fimbrillin family protein [Prevotella sp.]|nr:fimbrillin family protein [Prevotella sp.]